MARAWTLAGAFCAAFVCGRPAAGADNAPFYAGKQLSIVVNYSAGGPTDIEARLLARRLPQHIPGRPTIIVQNMTGGGGMIAVNWLGKIAAPDGLTMGYFTALAGAAVEGSPNLRIDPASLPFIAGVQSLEVYYARADLGGGLKGPADLMSKKGFWVGGLNPDSPKDIELRAEMDLLGLKYRYVSGYPGAAEARLALQQNEIQLTSESLPTYKTSIEPELIKTGVAIPLWYDTSAKYADGGDPDAQDLGVPSFEHFYHTVKGPTPDSALWRMYEATKETSTALIRTIVVPPGTPDAAVQTLRRALAELQNDPAYRADALKTIKYVPRFSLGPEAARSYRSLVAANPAMRAFIEAYVAEGVASVGK